MSTRFNRSKAVGLMLLSGSASVMAADPAVLDSVVIQGEHKDKARTVEVQSTAAAITSLSGAKLEEQGISSVRDLANIVPNLAQPRTAVANLNSSFYIRGIGEPDAQGEPSVAVYFDDLYWPKNLGANQELLDVERIEVFRGPQGQAFGHSSLAGVLRLSSTVPDETRRLRTLLSYGNYQDVKLGLATSGPVAENIFGSLAATVHKRDGVTPNVTVGRDTNDIDYAAVRGKLRFKIDPSLEATVSASGVRDRSTARGVQNLAYGDQKAHNQVFPEQSYDSHALSLTVNYKIDANLRLKLLAGNTHFEQNGFFDNTGDFYGRNSQLVTYRDDTWQGELQLQGSYDRVEFTTGLYAYKEAWYTNRRANTAANATSDPAAIRYRPVYTVIDQDTLNHAVYGELKLKVSEALKLTAGLRYNREEHTQSNQLYNLVATAPFQSNASNFLAVINAEPQALVWDARGNKRWNTGSPKVSADYQWSSKLLQYLTYSEGSKSAGYDYRAQAANGKLQAELPFNPEIARNLETGLKADWFGGILRTNVAAFYTRFDDIQLTTTDPTQTPAITRRFNAGQGSTRGLEFEGHWLALDGLQIDFSGAFLKARLDRFDGAAATVTVIPASSINPNGLLLRSGPFAGADLPNAPKVQGRLAATWRLPLSHTGVWLINGNVNYQAKSFTDTTNNPTTLLPAQTYLNGSITYIPNGSPWSVTLAGQNLANKRYALTEGFTPRTTPTIDGTALYRTTNYNDPRAITLALKYEI